VSATDTASIAAATPKRVAMEADVRSRRWRPATAARVRAERAGAGASKSASASDRAETAPGTTASCGAASCAALTTYSSNVCIAVSRPVTV
jgi:hypothetical protein